MKSVTMTRQSAATTKPGNYRLDISITSTQDITPALFVKQRIILPDGTADDTFVAVASPSEIEDIPPYNPGKGEIYFRDSSISLVNSDPEFIENTADSIIADVQLTIIQATELENLQLADTVTVDSSSVTIDPAPTNIIVVTPTVRVKDGMVQVYDSGFAGQDPSKPWCGITTQNGVVGTSEPLPE